MKTKGYVSSRAGRKKRGPLIHELYTKYKVKDFSKRSLYAFWNRHEEFHEKFPEENHFYLECRNLLNVSRNHVIQSLAGSVMNTAMIDVYRRLKEAGMQTKFVANTHDEAAMVSPLHETEAAAKILQECMENNRITANISIKMIAEPIITTENLAKAK
jgi:DNA polymerase I-like protein with 3'-5' exonuclease and polymerase domains